MKTERFITSVSKHLLTYSAETVPDWKSQRKRAHRQTVKGFSKSGESGFI